MASEVTYRAPGGGQTLPVGGDYLTAKATGDQTGGQYAVYEVEGSPGFGPPLHRHSWQELFYVLDGEIEFDRMVTGRCRRSRRGRRGAHDPAGAPHGFRTVGERRSRFLVIDSPVGTERFLRVADVPVDAPGAAPPGPSVEPDEMGRVLEGAQIGFITTDLPTAATVEVQIIERAASRSKTTRSASPGFATRACRGAVRTHARFRSKRRYGRAATVRCRPGWEDFRRRDKRGDEGRSGASKPSVRAFDAD